MMTKTALGYRITFEKHETVLWTNLGRGFAHLISGILAPFSVFPLSASGMKRYVFTRKLFELAYQYLDETTRCYDSKAYFAAGIVGCGMVEAILMLACVRDRDVVLQTRAWKTFAKKEKKRGQTFSELVLWIDFGNLIFIGKELGWFSADRKTTENFFAAYAESTDFDDVLDDGDVLKKMIELSPLEAVTRVHELRNFLHPGKCVRQSVKIEEKMAKFTLGLAYLSLMGVLDHYQGEPLDYVDLEIPAQIRNIVGWAEEIASSSGALNSEGHSTG